MFWRRRNSDNICGIHGISSSRSGIRGITRGGVAGPEGGATGAVVETTRAEEAVAENTRAEAVAAAGVSFQMCAPRIYFADDGPFLFLLSRGGCGVAFHFQLTFHYTNLNRRVNEQQLLMTLLTISSVRPALPPLSLSPSLLSSYTTMLKQKTTHKQGAAGVPWAKAGVGA